WPAGQPRAHSYLPRDEPPAARLRALAPGRAPDLQPPAVAVGEGLQEAPDPVYQLQIPRHRRGGPTGRHETVAAQKGERAVTAYVIRRLWQMVPTIAGVILLIFFLFNWVGGDPAMVLAGKISNPEQIANIRKQLGVDLPYWQ